MIESPLLPTYLHIMANKDKCWKADLPTIASSLIALAKQAGDMITSAKPVSSDSGTKLNSVDLVTETDQAVEAMISKTLSAKYPTFKFMGEETYKPGMKLTDAPTFVVDPIDGTTNFVHRYPYVSVSMGFAVHREPVVGVVYNPFTGQMYTGIKGEGSYLTEYRDASAGGESHPRRQRLPLKQPPEPLKELSEALLAIEWGSDRSGSNWETKIKTWDRLGKAKEEGGAMIHSARCLGSAALNLCAVASGSIDLYWEGGCWAWDVCAGWVILREAGGVVVNGNPGDWEVPIPVDHRKYLALRAVAEDEEENAKGQRKIAEEFWSFITGNMDYEH
jgi:myo-inositol-1(or 4)-monophosphatase